MTASTEQPEALRLAEELRECHPSKLTELKAASVIISQHARILELEAEKAARADLDGNDVIRIAGTVGISVHHDDGYPDQDRLQQLIDFVRIAAHGITQEKQG